MSRLPPGYNHQGSSMGLGPGTAVSFVGNATDGPQRWQPHPGGVLGVPAPVAFHEKQDVAQGFTNAAVRFDVGLTLEPNYQDLCDRNELAIVHHSEHKKHVMDRLHSVLSISAFNEMMTLPSFRKEYGKHRSCEKVLRDYMFHGIQGVANTGLPEHDCIMTFHVSGVSSHCYNIWNGAPRWDEDRQMYLPGSTVCVGDVLHLVLVRVKGDTPLTLLGKHERGKRAGVCYDMLANDGVVASCRKKRGIDTWSDPVTLDDDILADATDDSVAHCWQMAPFVCKDGTRPPRALYHNASYSGHAFPVGKVILLYKDHKDSVERKRVPMRNAVFPKASGSAYREDLHRGNQINISLADY